MGQRPVVVNMAVKMKNQGRPSPVVQFEWQQVDLQVKLEVVLKAYNEAKLEIASKDNTIAELKDKLEGQYQKAIVYINMKRILTLLDSLKEDKATLEPILDKWTAREVSLESIYSLSQEVGVDDSIKSTYELVKGKLLGHIVSKEGVRIDPKRIKAINNVPQPKNVKGIQSFLGKVIFVRWFIANFVNIVKPVVKLLKKDAKFSWDEEVAQAFDKIKRAIQEAVVLKSLDYSKPFSLFSFSYYHTIATVLLYKDDEGPYLVNARVVAYVPHAVVKDILSQSEVIGKRCMWINRTQEFDLEIKITKLVRGIELAKLMTESNLVNIHINNVETEEVMVTSIEMQPWYSEIVHV
ncbi:uncharacterized protein LOC131860527 [Cryptomeria japonica]|uniref:uncharacterized protein LOC131860527 n=1 Tax=Cryptomeria japonica TaxID=3369 RepID=UPI0027DA1AFA|nr:uncharacterized protein LOC131860527 [Cryptomeria japonica]